MTYTMSAGFFFSAIIFYLSRIFLLQQQKVMANIGENFAFDRILLPEDKITKAYYLELLNELMYGPSPDRFEDRLFLNAAAANALPENVTFDGNLMNSSLIALMIHFLGLRELVFINMISFVFYRSFAVASFLDVSLVWIESSRLASQTRSKRMMKLARWRRMLRSLEAIFFIFMLGLTVSLVVTKGESYTILDSILVLSLSLAVFASFLYGRYRLSYIFEMELISASKKQRDEEAKYLEIIKRTSTLIIVANLGIIAAQLYFVMKIKDFNDLVRSNNDPVSFIAVAGLMFSSTVSFAIACIWSLVVPRHQPHGRSTCVVLLLVQVLQVVQELSLR